LLTEIMAFRKLRESIQKEETQLLKLEYHEVFESRSMLASPK
jgi:hypothetical protein